MIITSIINYNSQPRQLAANLTSPPKKPPTRVGPEFLQITACINNPQKRFLSFFFAWQFSLILFFLSSCVHSLVGKKLQEKAADTFLCSQKMRTKRKSPIFAIFMLFMLQGEPVKEIQRKRAENEQFCCSQQLEKKLSEDLKKLLRFLFFCVHVRHEMIFNIRKTEKCFVVAVVVLCNLSANINALNFLSQKASEAKAAKW